MSRPVKDYRQPTQVTLELLLYAILDVVSMERYKHKEKIINVNDSNTSL